MSTSFEDLGLAPELVEALASEGIETPTPLQEAALPVVRRGNNLLVSAGPGAGTLVTYGAALLDRIQPRDATSGPEVLVLVPFAKGASNLAESLSRLGTVTGHGIAALGSHWLMPERAQILFATPGDLLGLVERSAIELGEVLAVVIDGAATIQAVAGLDTVAAILDCLPAEAQRIVLSLPTTSEVEAFASRHAKRLVHIPPRSLEGDEAVPPRGALAYRVVDEMTETGALDLVAELLGDGSAQHVLLFVRSDDRAADVGDFLTLYGYVAGAPGDEDAPVWLGVDEVELLPLMEKTEQLAVISVDVPSGPDSLDRRHGRGRGGHVLVRPRELAHLKDVAARTGFGVTSSAAPGEDRIADDLIATVEAVEKAMEEEDVSAYLLVLESLFQEHDPAEIAAAAVALLRKKRSSAPSEPALSTKAPASWVKLYVSLGRKDEAGPGDIVGAIAGEAGVDASKIGRIDVKESFSVVEVRTEIAEKVIQALNGTTVRGRSVRVDYDRGGPRGGRERPSKRHSQPK